MAHAPSGIMSPKKATGTFAQTTYTTLTKATPKIKSTIALPTEMGLEESLSFFALIIRRSVDLRSTRRLPRDSTRIVNTNTTIVTAVPSGEKTITKRTGNRYAHATIISTNGEMRTPNISPAASALPATMAVSSRSTLVTLRFSRPASS